VVTLARHQADEPLITSILSSPQSKETYPKKMAKIWPSLSIAEAKESEETFVS